MREDLLDDRLLQDRRDDLQLTATVRAVLQVEIEHPLEHHLARGVCLHTFVGQRRAGALPAGAWRRLLNLGYMYGPVSALGYALGYLMRKSGLQETPDPFFGAMVGTLVGAMLFVVAACFSESYRSACASAGWTGRRQSRRV